MDTFEKQLIENLPRFRKFAWHITHHSNDYEDFVQCGVARAWKFRQNYSEKGQFVSWICRIIHNEWKSHLRDKVRSGTRAVENFPEIPTDRSIRDAEARMTLQKISKISQNFPEKEKKIIEMMMAGHEPIEIGRALGVARGSIYSYLDSARRKFRSELNLGLT